MPAAAVGVSASPELVAPWHGTAQQPPKGPRKPPGKPPGTAVEVTNRSDGGFVHWLLKFYTFGLLCLFGILGIAGFFAYLHFATTLPALPDIATYHKVAARRRWCAAGTARRWRSWPTSGARSSSFEQFPPQLVQAFLSAEDRRFYEHGGLDYRGIARALGANLRAGEVSQGGSTITQQVAKSFLTSERTIQRKIREAILARRLEMRFTKRDILTLYLNQIFLGHGSFGVAAAARRYFDKPVGDLDIGEMALLAGLRARRRGSRRSRTWRRRAPVAIRCWRRWSRAA